MSVYYIDGQSQGNEQNSLPRKAKIAIAYAESDTVDHGKLRIYWQPIGDRTNNEAEYYALLKTLEMIEKLGFIRLEWVPREENYAGLWLEGKLKPFSVERLHA